MVIDHDNIVTGTRLRDAGYPQVLVVTKNPHHRWRQPR